MKHDFTGQITDLVELSPGTICLLELPNAGVLWGIKATFKGKRGVSSHVVVVLPKQEPTGQESPAQNREPSEIKPQIVDASSTLLQQRVLDVTPGVLFSPVIEPAYTLPTLPSREERAGMVIMVRDELLLCIEAQKPPLNYVTYLNMSNGEINAHIGGTRQSEDLLLEMGMYYLTRRWRLITNDQRVLLDSVKS